MHERLAAAVLATLILALTSCQQTAAPDTIIIGAIYTMDPAEPQVGAAAISNGRFTFVGSREQALTLQDDSTQIIHLSGATAYPGFIDAHLHVAGVGAGRRSVDLTGATNFGEIIARVAERAQKTRKGVTIIGRGWHQVIVKL